MDPAKGGGAYSQHHHHHHQQQQQQQLHHQSTALGSPYLGNGGSNGGGSAGMAGGSSGSCGGGGSGGEMGAVAKSKNQPLNSGNYINVVPMPVGLTYQQQNHRTRKYSPQMPPDYQ